MEKLKKYIGFDLGAESGRCIVAVLSNNILTLDEVHRFPTHNYIKDEEFHWDISKIFDEILVGLKNAAEKHGNQFESIGVDTWGVDYALVDKNGNLLNNPYHYRDDRTDNVMEALFKIINREELYKKTGIHTLQFNTVFQLLAEYSEDKSNISNACKFLMIPDYLNFLLSGKMYAEYSIASTTGLIDPYKRNWNWEIIETLDYDKHIFAPIVAPGIKIGTLLPKISDESGIKYATPIIASAGHDTAAAVASAPAQKQNWAFLSSGTWSIMGIEVDEPILSEDALNCNFSNEGGVEGTVRFLKNIIGLWPVQECRRVWEKEGNEYSYSELTIWAEDIGEINAWLDLNDSRFLKAGAMPDKIISFLNETEQEVDTSTGSLIRIVLESLAFNYRIALNEIETITGKKITELNAIGGGIQNELLCQLTADALNIPVVAGPVEGTIIGNIGVQAMATNSVKCLEDWRRIVENSFEVKTYFPKNSDYFNKNEARYKQICSIAE